LKSYNKTKIKQLNLMNNKYLYQVDERTKLENPIPYHFC